MESGGRAAFRPEFLNRLDEILLFPPPVAPTTWSAIVDIQLGGNCRSLLSERKEDHIGRSDPEAKKMGLAETGLRPRSTAHRPSEGG